MQFGNVVIGIRHPVGKFKGHEGLSGKDKANNLKLRNYKFDMSVMCRVFPAHIFWFNCKRIGRKEDMVKKKKK
jgi:hypothetical protein